MADAVSNIARWGRWLAKSSPPDANQGVVPGTLRLLTHDADTPEATIDLAAFWQPIPEGAGSNVNEVWELFGFGNRIEGLTKQNGGENSVLNFLDLYLPVNETEVLSPYFRIADGVTAARIA